MANTPEQTLQSTVTEIRNYLRDFPEVNRLLNAEETSDYQIRWHIAEVLDDFYITPPPIGFFSVERIPRSILLRGVLSEILRSVALLNLRNSLTYSDGGVTVNLDKHQALLQFAMMFQNEYEEKKTRYKVSLNIQRAFGKVVGVPSDYYYFSAGYYGKF